MPEEWRQAQYMAEVKERANSNSNSSSELIEEPLIEEPLIEEPLIEEPFIDIRDELEHKIDIINEQLALLDKEFNFVSENPVIRINENDYCSSDVKSKSISIILDDILEEIDENKKVHLNAVNVLAAEIHSFKDLLDAQLTKIKYIEFQQECTSEEFRDFVLKDLDIKIRETTFDNANLARENLEIFERVNAISNVKPDIISDSDSDIISDSNSDIISDSDSDYTEEEVKINEEIEKLMFDIDINMAELDNLDELVQFGEISDNIELLKIEEEKTKYILNIERAINAINKFNE
jgi:hypothetical protein